MKIDPVPPEERLPMFDWRILEIVKVNGTKEGDSFVDVIKRNLSYASYNTAYVDYDLRFIDNELHLYKNGGYGTSSEFIASGSWSMESGLLHLADSLNEALNEVIWLPSLVNDYEVVSYMGSLYVGLEFYHTTIQKDVYFFMRWNAYESER